jgi:hypothetical protein
MDKGMVREKYIAELRRGLARIKHAGAETSLGSVANELQMIFNDPERFFWLTMLGSMAEGMGVYSRERENEKLTRILGRLPTECERWFYRCCEHLRDTEQAQREAEEGIERIKEAVSYSLS